MLKAVLFRFIRRNGLIFPVLILFQLAIQAQTPELNKKITVDYDKVTVEKILQDLSAVYHLHFSYSPDLIPVQQIISYSCVNKALDEVLNEILSDAGISYSVITGYIVLRKSEPKTAHSEVRRQKSFTIHGTIVDSSGNEVLIGAAVYIKETGTGAITNNYGFFSLTVPQGRYTVNASYVGYSQASRELALNSDETWNIKLSAVPFTMKAVVINPVNSGELVFNALAGQTNLNSSWVQRRSAALGETDMIKSLDMIPGISFQSDGSSYFSVRGGARDQNLILLDEAPLFNPSHLLGLFTPIIPEAIQHTEIYRADFPVQYGGRISSVIDIRAKDGNMTRFSGSAGISPVSTRFSVEGPFRKDRSSYFMAFRISTFGLLVKAANPSVESFYFADFTSKFNFRLGKRDRLYFTLFSGKDAFINKPYSVRNGLEWGNSSATLRWSHVYGTRLFSNTTLYASKYDYSLYTDYDKKQLWNSDITGSNLKTEFTWFINPRNNFRFGFNISGYFFNPGNYSAQGRAVDTLRVSQVNSSELILYAGGESNVFRWLKMNYGFRLSNWSNYGESFSIVYDTEYNPVSRSEYAKGVRYYTHHFIEPRISLSVKTGKLTSFKVSYNRTVQHINQINNSISPFNSLEVWLPSGPNIKPQFADIADLGFIKTWPAGGMEFQTDIYYKELYNQPGYIAHAEMFLNPYLEGEIRQGRGYAYGIEIMLRKSTGRVTGQIGYAHTRSFLKIGSLNQGHWYPSHQDKPVDISFSLDFKATRRWTLNLNALYASGMAVSTPTGFYYYRGNQVPIYDKINNDRFPDYQRVDLGSVWRLNKPEKAFEHYFTLTIYNFFNTRNYAFLNFNKIAGNDDKYYVPSDRLNLQDQQPTYRFVYSIIPSFTYNLKF